MLALMAPLSPWPTFTEGVAIINQHPARISAISWPTGWDQEIDHS
jgi:hypothetical protein